MLRADARPKLASKVRLKFDRHSGRHWLLYPERGLALNASAARVAGLCTGERSVDQIIDALHEASPDAPRSQIAADVEQFLDALQVRALVHG
jgi:pyrroloquinoline quinone biosynthesis protein D